MAAPVVQTLAQVMADLAPVYAPQQAVIQQGKAQLGAKYDPQRAALTAAKGQGFDTISTNARGRGGSFSGVPQDEQARYLSTTYLPGMQQLDFNQNADSLALDKESAGIQSQMGQTAYGAVQGQIKDLNSWNSQQDQNAFTASQSALDRAATAAESAANRAATTASQGPSNTEIIDHLNGWAASKVGRDGKMSPADFANGYQEAARLGMDPDTYMAVMQRYVNNAHAKDYVF